MKEVETFARFRSGILKYLTQQSVQILNSGDQSLVVRHYQSLIYHIRTLTLLDFFNQGEQTEKVLEYFYPILRYAVSQILAQCDTGAVQNSIHIQNMVVNILLELKINNFERFEQILNEVPLSEELSSKLDPSNKAVSIYELIKQKELGTLEKGIQKKEAIRNKFKASKQSSASNPQFNVEDILSRTGLSFQTEHFVEIFPVDIHISDTETIPEIQEVMIGNGKGLLIEIQGDQHFDKTTGLLNLKSEKKLNLLKSLGFNVSWVSKNHCFELSRIENKDDQKALFWHEITKNIV